jgi:hypothetical protein
MSSATEPSAEAFATEPSAEAFATEPSGFATGPFLEL